MKTTPIACFALALAGCSTLLYSQTPAAPAAAKNLIGNGGFESSFRRENLWDGVDSNGFLSGERGGVPVLTTAGNIADSSMPLSVDVADMNNDQLPDIVTMDFLGYLRIYFNSGSLQEPKFTTGDLGGVFITRITPTDLPHIGGDFVRNFRYNPRLKATEMFKTGKKDLILGNYGGEIMQLLNSGSVQVPDFRQPQDINRNLIPTSKDPLKKWGNVFSPATWDWNKDGREDLLIGEGSYSANNIHLLVNSGAGIKPVFEEGNRQVLAFGDGLEQLSPTVVDLNADGNPDLLVSERSGKVAAYLNKGEPWPSGKPVPEIPFASFLNTTQGAPLSFGGLTTISAADMNADGLFDLVVGKANGRVAMALNKGTKQEPKFETPTEVKGTTGTPPMAIPSGWEVDLGIERGNFLAFASVMKDSTNPNLAPVEGKAVLVFGYEPSPNKIMPPPNFYMPGYNNWSPENGAEGIASAAARFFLLRQEGRARLSVGKKYSFSMKVRGKATDAMVRILYSGQRQLGEAKITRGDRDSAVVQKNQARESITEELKFSAGNNWSEVKKDFTVAFSNRDLKELTETGNVSVQITFSLPPGGELLFDDVKLELR